MRKKLLTKRQEQERWIRLVVMLLVSVGLVSVFIWAQRTLPGALTSLSGRAPLIVTATATQNAVPEKDEISRSIHPEENRPMPERSSDMPPLGAAMPYMLQMGTPKYLPAFAHPEKGCAWIGFGGQVFDEHGAARDGLVVFLTGTVDGLPVNTLGITAPQNVFGSGGYEIFLTDRLPEQTSSVSIQLFDVQGQPLSEAVPVALPTSCDQNLVLVNFQATHDSSEVLLPLLQGQ